jgi:predicted nucleic-acid-binding Zn-ribbon protein
MSEVKKCPKCGMKMVKSSKHTLGEVFGCTRRESEKPEDQRVAIVQPYYCKSCGYIELYKEL